MRVLVTGASGHLGPYLVRAFGSRPVVAWSGKSAGHSFNVPLQPVDLADVDQVAHEFRRVRPAAVIHAGAMAKVADCFRDPDRAEQVNVRATQLIANMTAAAKVRLVYISTDLVFDGERGGYVEEDRAAPLSVYGKTKLAAESAVLAAGAVVVRLSLLFGPSLNGRESFSYAAVSALQRRSPLPLFRDEWRTPLDPDTAARALVAVADSDFTGLLHVGGPERLSRLAMGLRLADFLGADPSWILPVTRDQVTAPEPRPRDTSLDSSKWRRLFPGQPWPTLEEALKGYSTLGAARE